MINRPDDKYEREADQVAEQMMHSSSQDNSQAALPSPQQRPSIDNVQRVAADWNESREAPLIHEVLRSSGQPLDRAARSFLEPRFGYDFGQVRIHTGPRAAESAHAVKARAFTVGTDIVFGADQYIPNSNAGRKLLAHELTHVVQQRNASPIQWTGGERSLTHDGVVRSGHESVAGIQRDTNAAEAEREQEDVTGPLTDREWQLVQLWLNNGEVGVDPLTGDSRHNAEMVAAAIFCGRMLTQLVLADPREDPLLCVIPSVTRADQRVQQLVHQVEARGPIINWTRVDPDQRMLYVMNLLVNTHGYPVHGAAGLVGNLFAESGVLPHRIEGSASGTPMRARDFRGRMTDFTAEQVMDRNRQQRQGPRLPGIGLAQWTSPARRAGLFQHQVGGRQVGAAILFNMDAQVDYLVTELQTLFPRVNAVLMRQGVPVDDASDEVVLNFETPAAVIAGGRRLPRADPRVQAVFRRRRIHARRALRVFREAHPED